MRRATDASMKLGSRPGNSSPSKVTPQFYAGGILLLTVTSPCIVLGSRTVEALGYIKDFQMPREYWHAVGLSGSNPGSC